MIHEETTEQDFSDRLGAAFDGAAARERVRMERRGTMQRAALWLAIVLLPFAAVAVALAPTGDRSDDAATTATDAPATSLPLVDIDTTTTMPQVGDELASLPEPTEPDPDPTTTSISGIGDPAAADDSTDIVPPPTTSTPATSTSSAPTSAPTSSASPSTTTPTPVVCAPTTPLDHEDLVAGAGPLAWSDSVSISAFDSLGAPAPVSTRNNVVAVSGGRYANQLDFDPTNGTSERIELTFASSPCSLELKIAMFEVDEFDGADESGRWTAYASDGSVVATGDFNAGELVAEGPDRVLAIEFDTPVDVLALEAIGYGAGVFPQAEPNNSDFAIRQLTIN